MDNVLKGAKPAGLQPARARGLVGEVLDGEGGYTVWGKLLPATASMQMSSAQEGAASGAFDQAKGQAKAGLPLGLAQHVKLLRSVRKGESLCWSDVQMDPSSPAYKLRREMEALFAT